MAKKKKRKVSPRFGGGILADNYSALESGKVIAGGIFTLFRAWDFPCQRQCNAIITLFDLPKRRTKVDVSVRKRGSRAKKLITIPIEAKKDIPPLIQSIGLNIPLASSGSYELLFSIPRTREILKIAFEVGKKEWPQFTKAEIEFAKTNPNCAKSIRANIHCAKCSYAYVFEETLLETPPDGGVHRFPETGEFRCTSCNHLLKLRDFQGQLRSSLKEQIKQVMGKKSKPDRPFKL